MLLAQLLQGVTGASVLVWLWRMALQAGQMLTLTFEGRWKELLNVAMRLEDPGNVPLLVSLPLAAVTERLLHLLPVFLGMQTLHVAGGAIGEVSRRSARLVASLLQGPMCAPELEPLPLAAVTERLLHLLPVFHGMHMPHSIGEAAVGERRDLRSLRHMCVHHASAHSSPLLLAEEARPHAHPP